MKRRAEVTRLVTRSNTEKESREEKEIMITRFGVPGSLGRERKKMVTELLDE